MYEGFLFKMEAHQKHPMTPEADPVPGPTVFPSCIPVLWEQLFVLAESVAIGAKWLNSENHPVGEL